MKYLKLFLVFIFSLISFLSYSQVKYYLGFAACGGSPSGHAFIMWGQRHGKDSSFIFKAYGFYPSHHTWPNHFKSLIVKVPSEILNEVGTGSLEDMKNFYMIEVDSMMYLKSQYLADRWKHRKFKLFTSDCVTFLQCNGLAVGLNMPKRTLFTLTPKFYMKKAIALNKNFPDKVTSCNNCCLILENK